MKLAGAAVLLLFASPAGAWASGVSTVGRDLVISREVSGRVVAVAADVSIEHAVRGDVVVWGGDVRFGPNGSIGGDLIVFGGVVHDPTSRALPVAGTVSTPATLLRLYLTEMKRAPWEIGPFSSVVWGLRLIALAGWLAATVLLLYVFGSPLARAAQRAESDWGGTLSAGVLGLLTMFLAAAAALSLLPSPVAVPVALVAAVAAVAAKVFGMGALFLLLGSRLLSSFSPARRPAALATGFAVLGGLSLLPVAGAIVWSAASVVAVGVALLSRFGAPGIRVALTT